MCVTAGSKTDTLKNLLGVLTLRVHLHALHKLCYACFHLYQGSTITLVT